MRDVSTAGRAQDHSARAVEAILSRYRVLVAEALRNAVASAAELTPPAPASAALLEEFYGQIEYHQGWRNPDLSLSKAHPGKLQRPTLVLLAAELAAGKVGAS